MYVCLCVFVCVCVCVCVSMGMCKRLETKVIISSGARISFGYSMPLRPHMVSAGGTTLPARISAPKARLAQPIVTKKIFFNARQVALRAFSSPACRTNRQAFTKQTKRRQKNRGADIPADAVTAVSIAGPAPAAPPVANTEGSQSMVEGFLSVWLSLPGGGEIELKCYFFFLKSFDIFQ